MSTADRVRSVLSRGLRGGDWPTPERSQPNSPPEWPQCGASSPMVGLDGSTALRKAVVDVLDHPLIQRCQLHKVRNVKDHLPQRLRSSVGRRMTDAYHASSALEAEAALLALAKRPRPYPPRAGGQPRRGPARDAHRVAPRCTAHARPDAALNELHRVDDLGSAATTLPTSNAGAIGRWRCAGARPGWSRPPSSSAASTVTCTCRRSAQRSNAKLPNLSDPSCTMTR